MENVDIVNEGFIINVDAVEVPYPMIPYLVFSSLVDSVTDHAWD